ncbi:MAG: hypothetical protein GF350_01250 [Chitinivibrionales bacterium]|nr:hypothetical protein [Chitinivibrionales bacterium]
MQLIKSRAIRKAVKLHGPITPCSGRDSLSDCFTTEINGLYLWFNCKDNSTRVIKSYPPLNRSENTETFWRGEPRGIPDNTL